MRKEIIFSAKDTGVADVMSRLRQSANELGRDLIKDARNFTTSGKEAVRYIEEQIKAMERRNKLDKEQQKLILDSQRAKALSGATSASDRKEINSKHQQSLADLNSNKREDEMQVSLLRELIETVKNSAREEIAEDRKDVIKQIDADKRLDRLGIDDQDEVDALKRTIQREEVGSIYSSEQEEKKNFDAAKAGKRASDETAGALSRPNEIYAVAGLMAMIPIVGDGIAMLANKALGEAEARQDARSAASGRQGGGASVSGANAYGMTQAEALSRYGGNFAGGASRALGMRGGLTQGVQTRAGNIGATEAMRLQMGMGIDVNSLEGLGGMFGYNNGNFQTSKRQGAGGQMFDLLTKSFANTGLMGSDGKATGNVNSIIGQTNQVLGQMTNTLDELNIPGVMASMSGLTRLGGSFADPERMGSRFMGLHQGLTDTSNPFAQAIKFSTMQGMGGQGKSRFELMEMQEKGMAEPGYMKNYMTKLHQMSGGNKDLFMEEVKAAFPQMSFSNTRKIVEGFLKDPNTFDVDFGELTKGKAALEDRNFTGDIAQRTAGWADAFADAGESIAAALAGVTDAISELKSWLE